MNYRLIRMSLLAGSCASLVGHAGASFHVWDIVEVYSNSMGTVQYIELFTANNNQDEAGDINRRIASNTNSFIFGADIPGGNSTANKRLLIGTASYAALSGVPAPDYIIIDNFFAISGDTLSILEDDATPLIDTLTFTGAQLPTDGINSLNHANLDNTNASSIAPGSPTNYAGQTSAIPEPGTLGLIAASGLLLLRRRRMV